MRPLYLPGVHEWPFSGVLVWTAVISEAVLETNTASPNGQWRKYCWYFICSFAAPAHSPTDQRVLFSICAFINVLMFLFFFLTLGFKNFPPLRTMKRNWNELISTPCSLWYADSPRRLVWKSLAHIQPAANPGVFQHSIADEFWHQFFLESNLRASFNLPMTHFWSQTRLWQNTADIL